MTAAPAARLVGLALALYFCHALWFAAAAWWMLVDGFRARLALRVQATRGLCLLPALGLAVVWFPSLGTRGFDSPALWAASPLGRLAPSALRLAILGGLRGAAEPALLLAMLAWLALGAWQHRRSGAGAWDVRLLMLAVLLLLAGVLLPDKAQNTIRFGARWMAIGVAALLLAAPAPKLRTGLLRGAAATVLGLFCAATAVRWVAFESVELAGLEASLRALPERPRVLGLSYANRSALLEGYPFLNLFAYAQVWRGGTLDFSLAELAPSLVTRRDPTPRPWTSDLQWYPERVRREDFPHFDFVLVQGDEAAQDAAAALGGLEPVTGPARWRLFRVPAGSQPGRPGRP